MLVIKREEYATILDELNLSIEMREKGIDVYHKNNWDRFVMHYDEESKSSIREVNTIVEDLNFYLNEKNLDIKTSMKFQSSLKSFSIWDLAKLKEIQRASISL